MSYLVVFLASLAWSGHCLGMCGGFALSLAAAPQKWPTLFARQLLYHAGKTFTYIFLGMLALALGLYLKRFSFWLGIVAGILLIAIGLNTLGVLRRAKSFSAFLEATPVCGMLDAFMHQRSAMSAFLLGLFNGFLPCPLVYAMLVYVATLPAWLPAMLTMTVFGLGTLPALVTLGMGGGLLKNRVPLLKISGALTIALGLITVLRGFDFIHAMLPGQHCH